MKTAAAEKVSELRKRLNEEHLVFIRVDGSPREYAICGVRQLQHNLEFLLAGSRDVLIVAPDDLRIVRCVEA